MDYLKLPLLRPSKKLLVKILDLEFQEHRLHFHTTDDGSYKIDCVDDKCTICQLSHEMRKNNDKNWKDYRSKSMFILPVEVCPNVSGIEEGEYRWEFGNSMFKAYGSLLDKLGRSKLDEILFTFDITYRYGFPVYDKCYFTIDNGLKLYVDDLRKEQELSFY